MSQSIRIAILIASLALTACDSSLTPTTASTSSSGNGISLGTPSSATTPTTATSTTTTTGTTDTTGSAPPLTMRVGAVGYTTTQVTVSAGTVLKVEFTPGQQDQSVSGTNFDPVYSLLGVYITVGSVTQNTAMLSNGLNGQAQTSAVLDFSSALSGCSGLSGCMKSVTITISKPNYDYWCLNYGDYCPYTTVYPTHPWNGTLTVQTDDTVAITGAGIGE